MECITEFTSKEDPKEKKDQNFHLTTGAELNKLNDLEKEKDVAVITVDTELNSKPTETKIKGTRFKIDDYSEEIEEIKTVENNINLHKVSFPS